MHGNIWEWCKSDSLCDDQDILNNNNADNHVLRGGCWLSNANSCRSAFSRNDIPDDYNISIWSSNTNSDYKLKDFNITIGFRLACCIHQPIEEGVAAPDEYLSPPSWASSWGKDGFGAWAEFAVDGNDGQPVTQRMRWIPPGSFLMGSPETEAGRNSDETQQEVNIKNGFWLADTACTQALWQAVMGNDPSRFKRGDLPVESVSWNDTQAFLDELNRRIPGLGLSLPSEAQWEYACRAGTTTAFSFGDNITRKQANQDGYDRYNLSAISKKIRPTKITQDGVYTTVERNEDDALYNSMSL